MKSVIIVSVVLAVIGSFFLGCSLQQQENTIITVAPEVTTDPDKRMNHWINIQCMDEYGDVDSYEIPVPVFDGFTEEFVTQYYEDRGRDFCKSLSMNY